LYILSTLLLLFTFSTTYALAEFYVIAGSRGVGTEIKSLPYTISSSGFYYITKDLSCPAGSHGITINAHNVTLDLMGFNLAGSEGEGEYNGINMNGKSNVEIRNGTIRNFLWDGIHEEGVGTGHRIINIRTRNNGRRGIYLSTAGQCHIVERCTVVGNGESGIYTGNGSTVTGNTCYNNNNYGIYANAGTTVTGNTCYKNNGYGISANLGSTVTGNTCYDNVSSGIDAYIGSTVTGNTCYDNGDDGIYAYSGSTVTGNTCLGNSDHGIYLSGYNLVDQNTAYDNGTNMNSATGCVFPPKRPEILCIALHGAACWGRVTLSYYICEDGLFCASP
jgi:parallel beta-helix repeat protein